MKKRGWLWLIPLLVLIPDRISKVLSVNLPSGGVVLIPGVLQLRYTENRGMAFSVLSGQPVLLGILSVAVILGAFLYFRKKDLKTLPFIALMLMLGGAVGNLIDRFAQGYVQDMIEVLFVNFAVFNVADMALTVGCGLLILDLLFFTKDWDQQEKKPQEAKNE